MKPLYLLSAGLLVALLCTNRENPIGPRNNPWDSNGDKFSVNGNPSIEAALDSTVWYDFDHKTGLGAMSATYKVTDPNLPKDTIKCRFFLGTAPGTMREIFAGSDSTLLFRNLLPKTSYRCSLTVADRFDSTDSYLLTFETPILIPPTAPVPSIETVGDTIKISWKTVASATGYRIYSADSLDGFFSLSALINPASTTAGKQVTQSFHYKTPVSKYFIVSSFNMGGESRSTDTLHGIIMSKEVAVPAIDSVSKGSFADAIKIVFHANNATTVGFEIYRSVQDSSSFKVIARVGSEAGANIYIDSVQTTDIYYYKIAAINKQGYSSYLSSSDFGYAYRISAAPELKIEANAQYIGLFWDPVPGARFYAIYRDSSSCPKVPSVRFATTSVVFYNDSVLSANKFYYSVAVIDSFGFEGARSKCESGSITALSGPKGFTISNQVRPNSLTLSWNSVPGAASYIIYRSTSGCPSLIDTFSRTKSLTFSDSTVAAAKTYFYAVAAIDNIGRTGQMSMCSDGSIKRLSSPTNFNASNAVYADFVTLSWDTLSGADRYVVYRSTTSCWEERVQIATTRINQLVDSVPTTSLYYYVVAGVDKSGAEGSASCAVGRVKLLYAPSSVTASYGEYTNGIRVTWGSVAGATEYIIYSGTSSSSASATVKAKVSGTTYFDSATTPTYRYYWVAAANRLGPGTLSSYAYGSVAVPPVLTISRYSSYVYLTWKASTGVVSSTSIQRAPTGKAPVEITTTTGTAYTDYPPDFEGYDYQVVVKLSSGTTIASNVVSGYKLLSPPTRLMATEKVGGCQIQWNKVAGATGYSIYKSASSSSAGATLYKDVSDTIYFDTMTTTTRNYYWIAARNSAQRSSMSSSYVYGGILQTPAAPTPGGAYGTTDAIILTWSLPSGSSPATGYYILRATSTTGQYTILDSTTLTTYNDSVTDSTTYYYKIAAYNQAGQSKMSEIFSGKLLPPSPPTLIAPSQAGLYSAYIRLTWTKLPRIQTYGIYRSIYSSSSFTRIGTGTDSVFLDTSAVPNTRYYYRITSIRNSVEGSQSTMTYSNIRLGPPDAVSAYPQVNGINVSWTSGSVRVRMYYLYRAAAATGPFTRFDSTTLTSRLDTNDLAGNNFYKVAASNLDVSPMSTAVTQGTRRLFPDAPRTVSATRGTDTSKVTVTWDSCFGAQGYRIYRSMSDSFTTAMLLGSTKSRVFVDTVASDSFYYYRIKSYNISGESSLSPTTGIGFRTPKTVPVAPVDLDTINSGTAITLGWNTPSNTIAYDGFKIYRAEVDTGTYALIDSTTAKTYRDVPPSTYPTVYWYTVTAYNKKGQSAVSDTVSATRR